MGGVGRVRPRHHGLVHVDRGRTVLDRILDCPQHIGVNVYEVTRNQYGLIVTGAFSHGLNWPSRSSHTLRQILDFQSEETLAKLTRILGATERVHRQHGHD